MVHPLTGETLFLHPDIAAQKHRWIHPDPSVPTPPESLPLFDLAQLDKLIVEMASLSLQHPIEYKTTTEDCPISEITRR